MKGFLQTSAILLFCFGLVTAAGKGGKASEEDSESEVVETQSSKDGKRNQGGGRCGCRDLENQIETLEFRLDRMIDLWNDFVDKNRNPYDQRQQGPYPDIRRPPQGGVGAGRGPYSRPESGRLPARPDYWGRGRYPDDSQLAGGRRYQF